MRAALALAAVLAVTAPARLDPTFGQGGEARIDLGRGGQAEALLLQQDGQVLVAGSSSTGTSPAFLVRLNTDGSPDFRLMPDDIGVDQIPALAQQPDGKVLVAWQTLTPRGESVIIFHVRLLRLEADGAPDPSFGSAGTVELFNGPAVAGAQAIAVQPDGRIVVLLPTALVRLRPDGSPDLRVDFGPADAARALALEPSGRTLVAGMRGSKPFVDAYLPDGSLDASFHAALGAGSPEGLVTLADGRIVVATRSSVERLLPNGSLEATGAVPGPAIALDARDRLVAAGRSGVTRLTAALAPDTSFGAGGAAALGAVDPVAIALQPDGKVLVAATTAGNPAVLRLPANAPVRRPIVTLTSHPRAVMAPGRVVFAFRADIAGATFRCSRDAGVLRSCHSPLAYTVGRGRHRFRVEALAGGVKGPEVVFRFSVRRGR